MKRKEQDAPKSKSVKKKSGASFLGKTVGYLLLTLIIVLLLAGGWALSTGMKMYDRADITKLEKEPPRSTLIYDETGNVFTELSNSRMEYITYDKFPKYMVDAIISVEDSRFYEHQGVDIQGVARALYMDLRHRSVVQGGSTVTQQLAKVMLHSSEQTFTRKINEALSAIKIERNYSKNQILEMYLNYIYYGEGAYGLQRAAQIYFGKDASDLTLAESALLAGLPKAPTSYSPVDNLAKSKARRNLVLSLMAEQGKITASQRDKAMAESIVLSEKSDLAENNKYASYVDHVLHEATDKFGLSEQEVLTSGLKIYTHLDPNVQDAAETVYINPKMFPEDSGGLQSAIVILDAKTGAIRGLVGGLNKNRTFRGFNYATQLKRQPGSSLKPIVVYAPALLQGYKPKDLIEDKATDFNGYKPKNYGDKFHKWVTMEESVAESYNVPAVAMLKEIGIDKGMDFAKQAGIPLTNEDRTFGIALGGMQTGTSPLTMAQAYTMFANGGVRSDAYAIVKIVDHNGKVIKEAGPVRHKLMEPSAAYTMTSMLQKVVSEGTGTNARMNWPVAGKTGTTQLPDIAEFKDKNGKQLDGSKDAWFVGYTPELVAAVWLGYQNTNRDHYLTTTGGKYPASIFKEVMSRALNGKTVTAFAVPNGYRQPGGGVKRINGTVDNVIVASAKQTVPESEPEELIPAATGSMSPRPSASPDVDGAVQDSLPDTIGTVGNTKPATGETAQQGARVGEESGSGGADAPMKPGATTAPTESSAPTTPGAAVPPQRAGKPGSSSGPKTTPAPETPLETTASADKPGHTGKSGAENGAPKKASSKPSN